MNTLKRFNEFNHYDDDNIITYTEDRIVYHITSESAAKQIMEHGFKTGHDLGISEKRKAVYFSDKSVNYGMYARNGEGEPYQGEAIGEVPINLKGLRLLNINHANNHKLYSTLVVRGELEQIPLDIDGSISFLEDGRIYEVCLPPGLATPRIII